jgi:HPP family/Protein of unknown function (DUF2510)
LHPPDLRGNTALGMLGTEREINMIAEYADSSIRATLPAAPAGPRKGSLPAIKARRGVNEWLYRNWGNRGNAVYTFIGSLLTIGISGLVAWGLDEPFLFPSLGATAFLMFETPLAEVSSPRNAIIGHLVGAAVAFFWLWVFGLIDMPSAIQAGFDGERVAAIALSLAFTGGILRLLPAGIINRLLGVPAPLWTKPFKGFTSLLRSSGGGAAARTPALAAAPNIFLATSPPLFQTPAGQAGPPGPQSVQPGAHPPEWYPDPLGNARLRYWDGVRWTDQTAQ